MRYLLVEFVDKSSLLFIFINFHSQMDYPAIILQSEFWRIKNMGFKAAHAKSTGDQRQFGIKKLGTGNCLKPETA